MEIGVSYPVLELGGIPSALGAFGRGAEDLGFDHIGLYEHVFGAAKADRDPPLPDMASERDAFHDPFVAFAYLAAITERVKFVTTVLVLPQRPTVLVAKQAADVDRLSNGRLRLGVGIGWNHVEYQALGQSFKTRGRRFGEQIGLLRSLWSEPVVSFDGDFDTIDRGGIMPRPDRTIPIFCGGFSEAAYERAARLADGFIFSGPVEGCLAGLDSVREHLKRAGREQDPFQTQYVAGGSPVPDAGGEKLLADIERWRDAGGTCVTIDSMKRGLASAEQHLEFLAGMLTRVRAILPG